MKRLIKRQLIASLAALLTWAAAAGAETGAPEAGRLLLSWHAPYGMPGATSDLTLAPGDTTAQDTLYLTCVLAVDVPRLAAMTGLLTIHAAAGDTLAPYWQFGHERALPNVTVQSRPDSGTAYPVPWRKGAIGVRTATYDGSGVKGYLAVIVAVGSAYADSMRAGVPYVLTRLLFRHPAAALAGSSRPVCVEWSNAKLNPLNQPAIVIERGDRFASWNSPGCAVCGAHRGPLAPATWKPRPRP